MKNTEYWFYIEPYVHTTMVKPDKLLMYNPLNYQCFTFSDKKIFSFVEETLSNGNSGIKKLCRDDLLVFKEFIKSTRDGFMADLIPVSSSSKKPISFIGAPMILSETGGPSEEKLGKNVLHNLTQITVYLNTACDNTCSLCHEYFKQTICCSKNKINSQIDLRLIHQLVNEAKESSLLKMNIVGGNIIDYPAIKKLIAELNNYGFKKTYFFNIKHLTEDFTLLKEILTNPENSIEIQFNSIHEKEQMEKISELNISDRIFFNLFIESSKDAEVANRLIVTCAIENSRLTPIYNGENIDFFEENVFTSLDDILEQKVSEKDVKKNYILNDNFFGHLIVFPDGKVYSLVTDKALGTFPNQSLSHIIHKELVSGNNWLKVRRKAQPCSTCLYHCLCQPISNYEHAIGKNNLCHIIP
jgi:pseudo-rSAM protein